MTNIPHEAAFTKSDQPYPAFINAQRDGDTVTVTIRSEARDGEPGGRALITMSIADFRWFLGEVAFRNVGAA